MEQKRASFDRSSLPVLLGLLAVVFMVIVAIIAAFGVNIYSHAFYGIFTLCILGLPIAGAILAYVDNKNLLSFEFLFNAVILCVALIAF